MKTDKLSLGYLEDAAELLCEAEDSFKREKWHRVVRKCQESAELAVKALFRTLGIEYPKTHYLGEIIEREVKIWDATTAKRIRDFIEYLTEARIFAFYGDEEERPPSEIYDKEDAEKSLEYSRFIYDKVKSYLKEHKE